MRPLSTGTYFKHNKKKLLSVTIIIVAAICLVYVMECLIASIVASIYPLDANRFKYGSVVVATEAVPVITQEMVDEIESSENIERTVQVSIQKITFSVPGSTTHTSAFGLYDGDVDYIVKKLDLVLESGRLPTQGAYEIAIDRNLALNNGLEVGDLVGSDLDTTQTLEGLYTVVGIFTSNSHISLIGTPRPQDVTLYEERGCLIFPNTGRFETAANEINALSSLGLNVMTLERYELLYAQNQQTFQILDLMVVLAIIVMVVCLVCSKYAQFFTRRNEIGVLGALGYTRQEITSRFFREVILTNIIGFVVGLLLAVLLCATILVPAFHSMGGAGVCLYGKAAAMALLAPLSTTVFTLIPVYRLIGRVDAISIVERN